jgi:hypothetical protein
LGTTKVRVENTQMNASGNDAVEIDRGESLYILMPLVFIMSGMGNHANFE